MKHVVTGLKLAVLSLMASGALAGADSMEAAAGKQVFSHHCHACHSEDPSRNTFGPSLVGVYERKAGALPRFAYSTALKESGLIWSEENLRRWVADNEALVPGTRMRHVAITDVAEQNYLIAFLKTLK